MPKYILGPDQILVEEITLQNETIKTEDGGVLYVPEVAPGYTDRVKGGEVKMKTLDSAIWYKIDNWGYEIEKKRKELEAEGIDFIKKGRRVIIKLGWQGTPFHAQFYTKGLDRKKYMVIEERMISMILDYSDDILDKQSETLATISGNNAH